MDLMTKRNEKEVNIAGLYGVSRSCTASYHSTRCFGFLARDVAVLVFLFLAVGGQAKLVTSW